MEVDYNSYQAQRNINNESNNKSKNNGIFLASILKKDGDVAIVRFPYKSLADVKVTYTHLVSYPGSKFPKRVVCEGANCPFCAQGVKQDARVFIPLLAYVPDEQGNIQILPAAWDRATPFIDIDLKEKMNECEENGLGPICDNLIKIKKAGEGQGARYMMSIVFNKDIYSPEIYKAEFSLLDNFYPTRMCSKTLEQYRAATTGQSPVNNQQTAAPVMQPINPTPQQVVQQTVQPQYNAPAQSEPAPVQQFTTPVSQPVAPVQPVQETQTFVQPQRTPAFNQYQAPQQPISQPGGYNSQTSTGPADTFTRRPIRHTF